MGKLQTSCMNHALWEGLWWLDRLVLEQKLAQASKRCPEQKWRTEEPRHTSLKGRPLPPPSPCLPHSPERIGLPEAHKEQCRKDSLAENSHACPCAPVGLGETHMMADKNQNPADQCFLYWLPSSEPAGLHETYKVSGNEQNPSDSSPCARPGTMTWYLGSVGLQ